MRAFRRGLASSAAAMLGFSAVVDGAPAGARALLADAREEHFAALQVAFHQSRSGHLLG